MTGTTSPRFTRYIRWLFFIYVLLGSVVIPALTWGGEWVRIGYPAMSWICLILLASISLHLRQADEVRISLACINVQALGIFCLLLGVVLGIRQFNPEADNITPTLTTISMGVLSTGLGILLTMLLKTIEDQKFNGGKMVGVAAAAAVGIDPAIADAIAKQAKAFQDALGKSCEEVERMTREMGRINGDLAFVKTSALGIRNHVQELNTLLEELGKLLGNLRQFFPRAWRM